MHHDLTGAPPVVDRIASVRGVTRSWPPVAAGAAVAAVLVLAIGTLRAPVPAGADTTGAGAGGGTVTVGAGSGAGAPGSGGGTGSDGPTGGTGGGTGSPWTCTSTYLGLNNEGGFPPGGPLPGAWYSVTCDDRVTSAQVTQTVWITGGAPSSTPAVDPRALALQAENSIALPRPTLGLDPSGTSVVELATWLWVDPGIWHTESVTATAGPVAATAVARPVDVRWTTGDGARIVCPGPGTAYRVDLPASWQSTDCSHVYLRTSAGQPTLDGNPDDATYVVTATVDWAVNWTSTGVAGGGALPTLVTTSAVLLRVAQVESVNTGSAPQVDGLPTTIGLGS